MVSVRTMRNEIIIREGDTLTGGSADNFYVVGEGFFQIHMRRDSGPTNLLTNLPQVGDTVVGPVAETKPAHEANGCDRVSANE